MNYPIVIERRWSVTASPVDVLFLSHRYEVTSGGEKALLDLIEYVVSINLHVHVIIGGRGNIVDYLDKWNVSYSIVHLPFWAHGGEDMSPFVFDQPANPTNNPTLKIVELIESLKPKLCVTNTIVVPWLAYASAITSTPHSWMIHELDTSGLNLQYAIDKEQIIRSIDTLSDKIFYNSQYTAQYYLPKLTYNKDISVIYPAGKFQAITKATPSPFKTSGLRIISVGQIKEQKGQIDAIKAAIVLKNKGIDFELLIVGGFNEEDKLYRNSLIELTERNDLNNKIRFLGHSDNPISLLKHAQIALNSATNETFGRVTVEAMLSGLAVIGADSAGTAEIIDHNKTGLLYKPGDHIELAEKILLLHDSPTLLEQISNHGKQNAEFKYSDSERFRPFVEYLNSGLMKKSLDLSPIRSVLSDFRATISLANASLPIHTRALRKTKRLVKKITKRA